MSQQKVDKYKEEKRNRSKIMKKQKLQRRISLMSISAVTVVLCAWFCWSTVKFYQKATSEKAGTEVENALTEEQRKELIKEVATEMAKPDIGTNKFWKNNTATTEIEDTSQATNEDTDTQAIKDEQVKKVAAEITKPDIGIYKPWKTQLAKNIKAVTKEKQENTDTQKEATEQDTETSASGISEEQIKEAAAEITKPDIGTDKDTTAEENE